MSNPNMIRVRTEEQEIKRQIAYTKTLRERVYRKADQKASEYDKKIEELEAQLDTVSAN